MKSPLLKKFYISNPDIVTYGFYNSNDVYCGHQCTQLTFWGGNILETEQIFEGHCPDCFSLAFTQSINIYSDEKFDKFDKFDPDQSPL